MTIVVAVMMDKTSNAFNGNIFNSFNFFGYTLIFLELFVDVG